MEDLQHKLNQVREKIQAIEGVEITKAHYNNQEYAYTKIEIYFIPSAHNVRALLDHLKKEMPNTVRQNVEATREDGSRECYLIELIVSLGKRHERERDMTHQINLLKSKIEDYFQKRHIKREHAA